MTAREKAERNKKLQAWIEEATDIVTGKLCKVGGLADWYGGNEQLRADVFCDMNDMLAEVCIGYNDKLLDEQRKIFFGALGNYIADIKRKYAKEFHEPYEQERTLDLPPDKYCKLRRHNTQDEVAKMYGLTQARISQLDKENGFKPYLDSISDNEYCRLRNKYTQSQLAEKYNMTQPAISYMDKKRGYKKHKKVTDVV